MASSSSFTVEPPSSVVSNNGTGEAATSNTTDSSPHLRNRASATTKSDGGDETKEPAEEETGGGEEKKDESMFECNICLDTAKEAVVSMCGHLFCWPCLHQWLETRPRRQLCPVCKAAISKDKVVPLYGRGGGQEDPRTKVPPRPAGQRTEPEPVPGFQGFGDGGFHMSFGIGAFPLGYLTSSFNFDGRARQG